MQSIWAFTKLVRPVNLLIIAATMYAMRFLVMAPILGNHLLYPEWKFALSVSVMVLLAAAGNIINDYFDLRVDRINKPERIVIDNGVKRRVAMAAHHAFNVLACFIGAYLAFDAGLWVLAAVPVFMAASLWFYSVQFKKQPFIGNLVVSLMVAMVPLWAGVFELLLQVQAGSTLVTSFGLDQLALSVLLSYAAFAFLLTLIREAQKDLEDLSGDRAQQFKTMPIAWGLPFTKRYALLLGSLVIAGVAWGTHTLIDLTGTSWVGVGTSALLLVLIPLAYGLHQTWKGNEKRHYAMASRMSKLAMAGGILMSFWIYFLML